MEIHICEQCADYRESADGSGYCRISECIVDAVQEACNDFAPANDPDVRLLRN